VEAKICHYVCLFTCSLLLVRAACVAADNDPQTRRICGPFGDPAATMVGHVTPHCWGAELLGPWKDSDGAERYACVFRPTVPLAAPMRERIRVRVLLPGSSRWELRALVRKPSAASCLLAHRPEPEKRSCTLTLPAVVKIESRVRPPPPTPPPGQGEGFRRCAINRRYRRELYFHACAVGS
jgi:hypothetical protein